MGETKHGDVVELVEQQVGKRAAGVRWKAEDAAQFFSFPVFR